MRLLRTIAGLTVLALAVGVGTSACTPTLRPDRVRPAPRPGAKSVVVLKSSDNPLFNAPLDAFIAGVDSAVQVFTLGDTVNADALQQAVQAAAPDLIVVLGTRATLVARQLFGDRPLLFAMVVNYKRRHLDGAKNVMGIALETPPAVEFLQFKMIVPKLHRVLAMYVPANSAALVAEARKAVKNLGIDLVAVPIHSAKDVPRVYKRYASKVDGVWMLNDPVVVNPDTFAYLRRHTVADKLPFFCSLSDRFAQSGALMSVSVDFTSLGAQAAAMARDVLSGAKKVQDIGVQPPIGSKLAVNTGVAHAIGIHIPADVLPFINEVIATKSQTDQPAEP